MNELKKPLLLRDEIHGDISFDPFVRHVIDHPFFQRLRYIKQLGLAEYVFPCATHTRFQHSLGAGYLAGEYFETMVRAWMAFPFLEGGSSGETIIEATRTRDVLAAVAKDRHSFDFWFQTASLAGLLHDVGHGPWSHTFEYLELRHDFSKVISTLEGPLAAYFKPFLKGSPLRHEDISVLYIHSIFSDLAQDRRFSFASRFILPVAMLVNPKMNTGKFESLFDKELSSTLTRFDVKGGVETLRLIGPLISGPFDVDRIDYIQRDGINCGVPIGAIEWRRIVSKLVPCLAKHPNRVGEPDKVVLLSNIKNHHVLDDFIFSLFQMYTQVYMHPKIVGIEEIAKRLLSSRLENHKKPLITFEKHASLSDDGFRRLLREDFHIPEIESLLLRRQEASFDVVSVPNDPETAAELKAAGFSRIKSQDRAMMKDSAGVFLYSSLGAKTEKNTKGESEGWPKGKPKRWIVRPWVKVSAVAQKTFAIQYSPSIWIKTPLEVGK